MNSRHFSILNFQKKISDIDLRPLVFVDDDATIIHSLKLMKQEKVGVLAIGKKDRPPVFENILGIITERDFLNKTPVEKMNWENGKIVDLMTSSPRFLEGSLNLEEVVKLFIFRRFRQLFIKLENGEVKIIGIREIINEIAEFFKEELEEFSMENRPDFNADGNKFDVLNEYGQVENLSQNEKHITFEVFHQALKEVINQSALIVDEEDSIAFVLNKLRKDKLAAAVIVKHGTLISGIVTERDYLFKVFGKVPDLNNTAIKEVMSPGPHFLRDRNKLGYAFNNMITFNFRNILIVDEEKFPLSIVNLLDILDYLCRRLYPDYAQGF